MTEELAEETLRQLGQQGRFDLMRSRFRFPMEWFEPGTATTNLVEAMLADADAAGLYLRREWRGLRSGGIATYRVLEGEREIAQCAVPGPEGKTPRSRAYQGLAELAQTLRAVARERDVQGRVPTVPLYGDYLINPPELEQLFALGAFYHPRRLVWLSLPSAVDAVRAILQPHQMRFMGMYRLDVARLLVEGDNPVPFEMVPRVREPGGGYEYAVYVTPANESRYHAIVQSLDTIT